MKDLQQDKKIKDKLENPEIKGYKFKGQSLTLAPITLRQLKDFAKIFTEIDPGDSGEVDVKTLFAALLEGDLINSFFHKVVFPAAPPAFDFQELPFDLADEILTDFFSLNHRLKKRLLELFRIFAPLGKVEKTTP